MIYNYFVEFYYRRNKTFISILYTMKKIYALFACSLLFLVGLFVNADSNVSSDLANAYRWAYSYWITTLPMEQARLNEPITRQAAAKMIVKFSINALGRTPDFSKSCTFYDQDIVEDLIPYVQKSCQLGLMGQNATSFNPYGNLTMAQFGTILSRLLWWNAYEGSSPYYAGHLRALQDYGILRDYWDPTNTFVTRWEVITMLQRSYSYGTNSGEFSTSSSTTASKGSTEYEYRNMNIVAKIAEDGTIDVLENLTTYFNKQKHGIIRSLPLSFEVSDKTYGLLIDNIDVAWESYVATTDGTGIYIKIWDEKKYVSWVKNYSILYSIYWLINDYSNRGENQLYWDIVPDGFDAKIKNVTAEIIFPKSYPELRTEDVLITVNGRTSTADNFNWEVKVSSDRIVINYTKWLQAYQGINVVIRFPKTDYFEIDPVKQENLINDDKYIYNMFFGTGVDYSDDTYAGLVEKIKKLTKNDNSHLTDLLKLEENYERTLENLSGSIESYINTNEIGKSEDPKAVIDVLNKAMELQANADKEYKSSLELLKKNLNANDEKYKLKERIEETIQYVDLSDGYFKELLNILIPMYEVAAKYGSWEIPSDIQEKQTWNTFSLFALSMTYSLKSETYSKYLNEWAYDVYKELGWNPMKTNEKSSDGKLVILKSVTKDENKSPIVNDVLYSRGDRTVITIADDVHYSADANTPRTEYRSDGTFKDYRDFAYNEKLSAKLKEMKLRPTSCRNIFCQQVADDGTYNNQKHYYWDEDEWVMTLIPGVYYLSCPKEVTFKASTGEKVAETTTGVNSTIHTWYPTPRTEYRANGTFKDYKDFEEINAALSAKLKEMKLRPTSCPNIFCQQVADDGTYNNQKHYYWNNDKGTMTLIPSVYRVSECSAYDDYANS